MLINLILYTEIEIYIFFTIYDFRPRKKAKPTTAKPEAQISKGKVTKPTKSKQDRSRYQKSSAVKAALSSPSQYTTMPSTNTQQTRLKLTIDEKFKECIRASKSIPVPSCQLTPPGKVPASPEYTPMTPESTSFYPEDHYDTPAPSPVEDTVVVKSEFPEYHINNNNLVHQPEGSSLADLDNLTDILQMPSNWQMDIESMDLSKLADTDFPNFDTTAHHVYHSQFHTTAMVPNSTNTITCGVKNSATTVNLNSNPSSHFEFPDYSTPEVSEMIGLENDWLDISSFGTLATAH